MGDVTVILDALQRGDRHAAEELIPLVYEELRRLAAARIAQEPPGQTLQATALVHEAYLRLVGSQVGSSWEGRRHFFGAAAEAMRRILIEKARRRQRLAAGGYAHRVELDDVEAPVAVPAEELLGLHEALEGLAQVAPQAAEVVKLRFFVGLSQAQIAELLGVSRRTADSRWALARAWLSKTMRSEA